MLPLPIWETFVGRRAPRTKYKALERVQNLFKAALQLQYYKDKNCRNAGKKGGNKIKG